MSKESEPIRPSQHKEQDDVEVAISTNRARQGVTGQGVRYVLFISLAATIVAFIAIAVFLA